MTTFPIILQAVLVRRVENELHKTLNRLVEEMDAVRIPSEASAAILVAAIAKLAVDVERAKPDMRGVVTEGMKELHEAFDKRDQERSENPDGVRDELARVLAKALTR